MTKSDKARERDLFRRIIDGSLTVAEFAAVEERLLSDQAFRERYVRAIDVEAGLYEAFNFPGTFPVAVTRAKSPVGLMAIAAMCATLLLGVGGWYFWSLGTRPPKTEYAANLPSFQKPVAIVTQVQHLADDSASPLKPGMRIRPGLLSVGSGQVQIEFLNGTQINVEGPADLQILSVDAATLLSGKAAARVPPGARGFVLNTPGAAIVDMGTEFAVSVGKRGDCEVYVIDGAVDVSLLGNDGNTLKSQKVTEAKSLRVKRNPAGLERIAAPRVTMPGMQSQMSGPLRVNEAYVRSIHTSRPAIYWRFEKLVDGQVPNEMGARWSGRIHAEPDDSSAIVVRDGVARFTPSAKPHRLEPDESIPGFNRESFTVEFWVSPDNFHWATLVAIVPEEKVERNLHLSLIELPYKSSLVYTPGSFRFLHRHPPGGSDGTNLFSEGDCTPGLWHHLAAVKTPGGMKLFLNGQLVRQFAETAANDDDSYRFFVGQLYEGQRDRQLSGAIAEFAVYLRELEVAVQAKGNVLIADLIHRGTWALVAVHNSPLQLTNRYWSERRLGVAPLAIRAHSLTPPRPGTS